MVAARAHARNRCSMIATVILVAAAAQALAQPGLQVDVNPHGIRSNSYSYSPGIPRQLPQTFNSDLYKDIQVAHEDATLLYTDFTSRARREYKYFVDNVTSIFHNASKIIGPFKNTSDHCMQALDLQLRKAQHRAIKSALFNGENHHKYFKGHVIVFRMHINKSEEYVQKCDRITSTCGENCDANPRLTRWRRQANHELQRFREDFRFSQRFYHDILTHGRKYLIHLKKEAMQTAEAAKLDYQECRRRHV